MVANKEATKGTEVIEVLDISDLLGKLKFDSFKALRNDAETYVRSHRDNFIDKLLEKYGVIRTNNMTSRELNELLEGNKVNIDKDIKTSRMNIYKDSELIGFWSLKKEIFFDEKGHLMCSVQYTIY